jgi:glycosyltransferase involved in cell wall biosynthesis
MRLEIYSEQPGVAGGVYFHGYLSQAECARQLQQGDALVLPSLLECGGAVVLEAMAVALPVIATDWGGPADYLDPNCGILVTPSSRTDMVEGFAAAMVKLANDPELSRKMGAVGRQKIEKEYDWDRKVDKIRQIYSEAVASFAYR